jgi:hypothetical protein
LAFVLRLRALKILEMGDRWLVKLEDLPELMLVLSVLDGLCLSCCTAGEGREGTEPFSLALVGLR